MKNNSFSVKAIKLLTTLFLYLGYFGVGLVVVITMLRLTEIKAADKFKIGFPVAIHYEIPGLVFENTPAEVEFEKATIDIVLSEVGTSLFIVHITSLLMILAVIIYCTKLFLKSINSIADGNAFNIDNINRFKRIGLIMVIVGLLPPFYLFVVLSGLNPEFEGIRFPYSFGPNLELMLSGFFLMVMAEVFKKGLQIKEENELTV